MRERRCEGGEGGRKGREDKEERDRILVKVIHTWPYVYTVWVDIENITKRVGIDPHS